MLASTLQYSDKRAHGFLHQRSRGPFLSGSLPSTVTSCPVESSLLQASARVPERISEGELIMFVGTKDFRQ